MLKLFERQHMMKYYFRALRETKRLGTENMNNGFSKEELLLLEFRRNGECIKIDQFTYEQLSSVNVFVSDIQKAICDKWSQIVLSNFLPRFWQVFKKYGINFMSANFINEKIRCGYQVLQEIKRVGIENLPDGFCEDELYLLDCLVNEKSVDFNRVDIEHMDVVCHFVSHFENETFHLREADGYYFLAQFWQMFERYEFKFMDIHYSQLYLATIFWRKHHLGLHISSYYENYLDKMNHYEDPDPYGYHDWGDSILDDMGYGSEFYHTACLGEDEKTENEEMLTVFAEHFDMTFEELWKQIENEQCFALEVISDITIQDINKINLDEQISIGYSEDERELYLRYEEWYDSKDRIHLILDILECIKEEREQHENSNNN